MNFTPRNSLTPVPLAILPSVEAAEKFLAEQVSDTDPDDSYSIDPPRDGAALMQPTCPSGEQLITGVKTDLVGCDSTNVVFDGDVFDCLDCGLFFNIDEATKTPTSAGVS